MVSIKDVAKQAGVGVGTVSRFINDNGYVSDDSKAKIAKAIKELGYKPNQLARNLVNNSSKLIGVIVPNIEHPFYAAFTRYVEQYLYENGYKTLICNTVGISDREKIYIEMLDRNIVDGIISCTQIIDNSLYTHTSKPIVALDHNFSKEIPVVYSNHNEGGRLAAELILQAGCKNVLQFMTPKNISTPSNTRHFIFEKIIKDHDIPIETFESEWNIFDYECIYDMFKKKIDSTKNFDGIFASDLGAVCCLNILQEKGISIPEEVKIVGYDGLNITNYTNPKITTISQNIEGLAASCVEIILKRISNISNYPSETIWPVSIKKGNSI